MVIHIVGNRPQFIKLSPVMEELRKQGCQQAVIHTGQHYDENMSGIFFEELGIPQPDRNLAVGSGTHAEMTGKAMIGIEKALMEFHAACVVLYGDTDSTLAGALAAVKLGIPIVHVEAGIRTGKLANPEESNRIVTDHLSDLLFCPDRESMKNLDQEGIQKGVFLSGDVMYDTFLRNRSRDRGAALEKYGLEDDGYVLMTWHRQENTCCREQMERIIQFLGRIGNQVVYPVHPRTKAKLEEFRLMEDLEALPNVKLLKPLGYSDMAGLMSHAHMILTDSGGVSKESYFAGTRCIFMADLDLWPDLLRTNWITKLDVGSGQSIDQALALIAAPKDNGGERPEFYGAGDASVKIAKQILKKYF